MLRDVEIPDNVKIRNWDPEYEEYYIWIYDQLMGETEHGDRMEPKIIRRGSTRVYCGLLWGKNGNLKGIVPELFETSKGSEYLCIAPDGIDKGYKDKKGKPSQDFTPISLDEATARFLSGEKVWL